MDLRKFVVPLAPLGILAGFSLSMETDSACRLSAAEIGQDETPAETARPVIQPVAGKASWWGRPWWQRDNSQSSNSTPNYRSQPQPTNGPFDPVPDSRYQSGYSPEPSRLPTLTPTPAIRTSPSVAAPEADPRFRNRLPSVSEMTPAEPVPKRVTSPLTRAPKRTTVLDVGAPTPAPTPSPAPALAAPDADDLQPVPVRAKKDFQPMLESAAEGPTLMAPGPAQQPKTVIVEERPSLPIAVSPPPSPEPTITPVPDSSAAPQNLAPRSPRPQRTADSQPKTGSRWFTPLWRR